MVTLMDNDRSTTLVLSEDLMGYEQIIFLTKDDITQVLDMEKLSIPIIQNFIGCIRVYGFNEGKRKSSKAPQWLHVKCARQPGVIECGYYIMRYILEHVTRSNPAQPIDEI
ncbi:hypothetical protein RND81_13G074100 [Saponaria officinalis]|uniref:Ubiquitin-like protease family profile domain-containing protein n=1 Tax=Saponaria officinalis TaxID=3572 RepID=A0AAW1GXX8_SAPOF